MTITRALNAGLLVVLCGGVILSATRVAGTDHIPPPLAASSWMQEALNDWQSICADNLHLEIEPLPWLIFYDEHTAWHVNADETFLPPSQLAGLQLNYHARDYQVRAIDHEDGKVWLPDRPPMLASEARIFTSPYADGKKSVVVCALPVLVGRKLNGFSAPELEQFLLGIVAHEMTHTKQAEVVDARLKELAKRGPLPASFDDNIVESTFGQNKEFQRLFEAERDKLLTAALQDDEPENGNKLVNEALGLVRERRAKFYVGENANYAGLEDIFLTMEGIGQWVHFQVVRKKSRPDEPWQKTAQLFLERTKSWVQWEGFALFLLIDRKDPNWQKRFFSADFPSPFEVLTTQYPAHPSTAPKPRKLE